MSTPFLPEPDPAPERDNGLVASSYRRLRTIERRACDGILEALAEAEIACYTAVPEIATQPTRELFVDASKQALAHEIADQVHRRIVSRRVSLDPDEVDSRFAELIGSFSEPSNVPDAPEPPATAAPSPSTPVDADPPAVWRAPTGDSLEDPPDDDEGYVPPPPEPLPRPTRKVVLGILLMVAGAVALFAPMTMPIPATGSVVLGVILLAAGTGWLVMQLRDQPDDPFDDGARV